MRELLLVLCPSYKRPIEVGMLMRTFMDTVSEEWRSRIWILVNSDERDRYWHEVDGDFGAVVPYSERPMIARSNAGAVGAVGVCDYIGWVADDNRFETPGWDEKVIAALQKTPVVFCNDVVSPGSKPSHVFMDSRIPKALGWFLHPDMRSTFFDDVWHDLGKALGITYLDDVRIPHLYVEKDNREDFFHDMEVYQRWQRHDMEADIAKARAALRPRRNSHRDARYPLASSK